MTLVAIAVLTACGDNLPPRGELTIVGHSDINGRGMNAAVALADDVAYVGSRIDKKGIAIVDISDPARPTVVGEIGPPDEGLSGMSSRELRAIPEINLLVVLNLQCSPSLHGCASGAIEQENLKFYDITNRRGPQLLGTYYVAAGERGTQRSPHEFYLWRDPVEPTRVIVLLAATSAPGLEILEGSLGAPVQLTAWDPTQVAGFPTGLTNSILHSVSASDDGRTIYLSHQTAGLYVADITGFIERGVSPQVKLLTPATDGLRFGVMGPHSAVPVPERDLLVVTEEIYPKPFGEGCPWGHLRIVDIADPAHLAVLGEYKLAENDCLYDAPMTAYTAHNVTATKGLALVTWYAGGLQVLDISDATNPIRVAEFRPDPLPSVAVEDPGLGGSKIEMWSYPIIRDGLIYVVDSRNGLYILSYQGRYAEQIDERRFLEGNSNLGAYVPRR